jgi:hypothetical protein
MVTSVILPFGKNGLESFPKLAVLGEGCHSVLNESLGRFAFCP